MKKILTIVLISIVTFVTAQTYPRPDENSVGRYNPQCPRCKELTLEKKKGYSYCLGCPMFRRYDLEKEDNLHNAIYKCKHGHTIIINLKEGDYKLWK